MNILFIAPLPPPLTGHSLVDKILLDELVLHHNVNVVDLSKNSLKSGNYGLKRAFEVIRILKSVWISRKNADIIYLTISESLAGNIKDLLIYLICFKKLHKTVIHLHGGSIKRNLFDKSRLLKFVNKFFLQNIGVAVILGASHHEIFSGIIDKNKVIVVPNFAEDDLFLGVNEIKKKFENTEKLNVLFVSNLIDGKGYIELVNAYLNLDLSSQQSIRLDIAGAADPESIQRTGFLKKIAGIDGIHYHRLAIGLKKRELFAKAHILCFPSYLLEGQGIVILEAYASGCVVMTTGVGGIKDIFQDEINGYKIEKKSSDSIRIALERILKDKSYLLPIAIYNNKVAFTEYRSSIFNGRMIEIIDLLK
jgi:glycosyltransferase involved in cell wall biosynthesis